MKTIFDEQRKICIRNGSPFSPVDFSLTVGVSKDLMSGAMPINGLRHPPDIGTTGWFLWSGTELNSNQNYFVPTHLYHLLASGKLFLPYLALAPGWRFLTDGISEDVWYDQKLLNV
jgi:hypothetical protein